MHLSVLTAMNASLNAASAILLMAGFVFIKRKNISAHKICMLSAAFTSTLFLISYLYYHTYHGLTRFRGVGAIRAIYFSILISHTVLSVVQVPLLVMTLFWAFRSRFDKHKAIARITLPVWLYVSVTGVVVYVILYKLPL